MGKLRSVNTEFWSDPWIEELNPTEKLLYLYLITNEKTNMLGVYELSIKKISFETGLNHSQVDNALKHFERVKKVKYTKNYIVLINFTKHQNYNTNMMKSAIDVFNNLPNELKTNKSKVCKENPLKGFQMVSKDLGMVRKIETEDEVETEDEDEEIPPKGGESFKFDKYLETINDLFGRSFRIVNEDVRRSINARLKSGYTKEMIMTAMLNAKKDEYHKEKNYKYCTPEFFSRTTILDKYSETKEVKKQNIQL